MPARAPFDDLRQGIKEIEFVGDPHAGELRISSQESIMAGLLLPIIQKLGLFNQIRPYANENEEVCGLAVNIMGLVFVLMLAAPDLVNNPQFKAAKYRPGEISISDPLSTNCES